MTLEVWWQAETAEGSESTSIGFASPDDDDDDDDDGDDDDDEEESFSVDLPGRSRPSSKIVWHLLPHCDAPSFCSGFLRRIQIRHVFWKATGRSILHFVPVRGS